MNHFTGTWQLLKLGLKRDRIKLPLWVLGIATMIATAVPTLKGSYGTSHAELVTYASTTANSFAARFMTGPIGGPELGAMLMNEYYNFTAILIAFVTTMAVVRHTRQNEETGRSELIDAGAIGRYAQLTAGLLLVVLMNIVLAGLIFAGLTITGMNDGALAIALAFAGVGSSFAAVAAVAAQVANTARGANAIAGAIIGLAVVLRGVGDALGTVAPSGLSVDSSWQSWLSPIGWGQQLRPFVDTNWWVLGLFVATFIGLTGLSYWLTSHRDHGSGMLPARLGRQRARASLLSPLGLAWRLDRGILLGWTVAVGLTGLMFGALANEFKDFFKDNDKLQAFLAGAGDSNDITGLFLSVIILYSALMIAAYAIQSSLILHSEESSGRLEKLFSTAISRLKWSVAHVLITLGGVAFLGTISGLSIGLAYGITSGGEAWQMLDDLTIAGLVQVPSIVVFVGIIVCIFGVLPRFSQLLAWPLFAITALIVAMGEALSLPDWALKLSPFWHTPPAPADTIETSALWIMLAIGTGLIAVGLGAFRIRDISSD